KYLESKRLGVDSKPFSTSVRNFFKGSRFVSLINVLLPCISRSFCFRVTIIGGSTKISFWDLAHGLPLGKKGFTHYGRSLCQCFLDPWDIGQGIQQAKIMDKALIFDQGGVHSRLIEFSSV